MALCHYPCPEEIDVFTGPHMRMKQLVYEALEKVRSLYLRELFKWYSLCCDSSTSAQKYFTFAAAKGLSLFLTILAYN